MRIVELLLDEESLQAGIQAISIVEAPAIEEDFVALKEQERVELKTMDEDKRLLLGAALVPNKPIYRRSGDDEYYIYFSQDTVRKASELFFINGNQNKATLEHQIDITGLSVVESWIIEGEQDKSKLYGMDLPVGTWMVSMKVHNDEVWNDYVKEGKVKGFSIEGYFVDKVEASKHQEIDMQELEAKSKLNNIKNVILEALGKKLYKIEMSILGDFILGSADVRKKTNNLEDELKRMSRTISSMVNDLESDLSKTENAFKELKKKSKELGMSVNDIAGADAIKVFEAAKNNYQKYRNIAKQISKLG